MQTLQIALAVVLKRTLPVDELCADVQFRERRIDHVGMHRLCALGDSPAYLWVLDGNVRAIGFYERHGFAFDGATKPEDVGLERRMVRGPTVG